MKSLLVSTLIVFNSVCSGQALSAQEDYRRMVDALNQRYEDFFIHEDEIERFEAERKSGVGYQKDMREAQEAAMEEARLEAIRMRKVEPDTTELERQHDLEVAEQKRQHDQYRKEYSSERSELEKIRQTARKIPDNKDAGLE